VDARLAEFAAQRDAAAAADLGALHTGAQRAHLGDQFHGDVAAVFARQFAAIERHPEVGATGSAIEAGVGVRLVTGQHGG